MLLSRKVNFWSMKINQSSFWFKTGAVIIPFFFSLIIFLFTAGTAQGQTINPGFESGTVPWVFYINTATGSFQSDAPGSGSPRAGHITILQPGSNVQLYQVNLALEPNTQYRLSFKAYSNTGFLERLLCSVYYIRFFRNGERRPLDVLVSAVCGRRRPVFL